MSKPAKPASPGLLPTPGAANRHVLITLAVALVSVVASHRFEVPSMLGALLGSSMRVAVPPSSSPPPRHPTFVDANGTDMVSDKAYNTPCLDHSPHCSAWRAKGECSANSRFMLITCAYSCGTCASTARAPPLPPTQGHANLVEVEDVCSDESEDCASWASVGECTKNAAYMTTNCPLSCRTCDSLRTACARDDSTRAFSGEPGSLNRMFERAVRDFPELSPTVLHRDPWLLKFENFIDQEDVDAILSHCNSSLVRSLAGDQVSPVRTSNQCWCSTPECLADPRIARIAERVANLTQVPSDNFEYMQVLRYEKGQFYKSHHDQNSAPWTPQGVRLLTFYMYLNDVEEGGGTHFGDIDMTVQPRRGTAVLWPSVLDSNLEQIEPMTHHEALPPLSGTKFGANLWLHQFSFKGPSSRGCKWTSRNTFH